VKPTILFRTYTDNIDEYNVARRHFNVTKLRTNCKDSPIICRYSALPYYQEVESDLANMGCTLINSWEQHKWVADFEWYEVLKGFTPETWDDYTFPFCSYTGPFIVKGRTNSRKFEWDELMFAKDKRAALNIGAELMKDPYIGTQGIIYRKYIPLETFEIGIYNLPFTNEYRIFFLYDNIVAHGYYWSIAENTNHHLDNAGLEFAKQIGAIIRPHVNFFAIDIAKTVDGQWILIEINDGQQSGLSEINIDQFYKQLYSLV
jgi:hypothetical protein